MKEIMSKRLWITMGINHDGYCIWVKKPKPNPDSLLDDTCVLILCKKEFNATFPKGKAPDLKSGKPVPFRLHLGVSR